jgi:predicted secreted hydrolase
LAPEDVSIEPLATTTLASTTLPTRWRVTVKSRALNIETIPLNPASWMGTRFAYWEGPIRFTGTHGGEGYLEMTGY